VNNEYVIFADFDGTITAEDVGYEMFRRFTAGRTEPVVARFRRGEVNLQKCLETECEIWNLSPPPREEVFRYLRMRELTPGFGDFVKLMADDDIRTCILSEGFDFYIDEILRLGGLSNLERITNKATFADDRISPEFPYLGQGCGECTSCKGYHIRRLANPRSSSVFIGDGHSDFHGARAADLVFARSFLSASLKKNGRHHFEFADFYDIMEIWKFISGREVFASSERLYFCRATAKRHNEFQKLWENGEVMKEVGFPGGLGWTDSEYDRFWKSLQGRDFILFAIENRAGEFMGEAKLSFPDGDNFCRHDVKLLPEYRGRGFGKEAWRIILDLCSRRWPEAIQAVSPAVNNKAAIALYESLGFEAAGDERVWRPPAELINAVPVFYKEMVRKN
jgi:2-hydroxy-3-keto-5-methylthiopentenyl-1-phosphate phosphatase